MLPFAATNVAQNGECPALGVRPFGTVHVACAMKKGKLLKAGTTLISSLAFASSSNS